MKIIEYETISVEIQDMLLRMRGILTRSKKRSHSSLVIDFSRFSILSLHIIYCFIACKFTSSFFNVRKVLECGNQYRCMFTKRVVWL